MSTEKVSLVGGGLAGSLLAVYLAKQGFKVEVYERRPDMRRGNVDRGRSINLALSLRGIHALKEVNLFENLKDLIIPMKGRMIHSIQGDLSFQPYGKDQSEVINSISRAELNMALMNLAEKHSNVRFHFEEKCTGMDFQSGVLKVQNQKTEKEQEIQTQTVIGTDGSASAIRASMEEIPGFSHSQQYLEHGYKELTIPAALKGGFRIEKNALHIWPRKTFMLIALPNIDGSFTCTLFLPFKGPQSFEALSTPEKVKAFFQEQFPDAVPLIPMLTEEFFTNPTGSLVTVRCFPWHFEDRALLLGDAAHAMVPFFGQGMNCAFEDCSVLNECVEKFPGDFKRVFEEYEKLRKINTDAISALALENFIEMRDLVGDPKFLLRKKVEQVLEEKYPGQYIPKYSLVTFQRSPYSQAKVRGERQSRILDELCSGIKDVDELDFHRADQLIKELHAD